MEMKMELDKRIPKPAAHALARLEENGFEAYLAGGCVRDFLLGREPHDFDITTIAEPKQVMAVFAGEKLIPTGLQHGTVTLLTGGMPLEITTYRIDGDYSDGRRPDWVEFSASIEEDLARRDFTINAFAYSPKRGLVDLFGGRRDLEQGVIRCVGEADERFAEDGLRILRAVRFASQLGFSIEEKTGNSILNNRQLLLRISKERIASEMTKLLTGQGVEAVITDFFEVIETVIPEVSDMKGFEQNNPYHKWDVLRHTACAVGSAPADEILRWAAFLHDIGKPACYSQDENGRGHFFGHESRGAEMAEAILRDLRCAAHTVERVSLLVRYHDVKLSQKSRTVKRWLNRLGEEAFFQLLELQKADRFAHQGPACKDLETELLEVEQLRLLACRIIEEGQCFSMKDLAVTGRDLIQSGFPPGKGMGDILKELLSDVIEERCENEKSALMERAREKIDRRC